MGGVDDETAVCGLAETDAGQGLVPFLADGAQGDVAEGLGHAVCAPDVVGGVGVVSEFCGEARFEVGGYGAAADDDVAYA